MRTSSRSEHPQGVAHLAAQELHIGSVERIRRSGRIEPRSPQQFVSEKVSEPGEPALIHEPRFQRRIAAGENTRELFQRDVCGI